MTKLSIFATGLASTGLIEAVDQAPTNDELSEIIKIAVQILIGIATIIGMMKKKKK